MKLLELKVSERLVAISIFNNPENKVPTSDLKVYLEDVNKFRFNEEYKLSVKWEDVLAEEDQLNPRGEVIAKKGDTISYKWDETGVDPYKIEIDEFTRKFLQEKIEKLEVTASDPLASSIASLLEKVK